MSRRSVAGDLARSRHVRFLAAGAIAATANFLSRILFNLVVSFEVAVLLAFFVGLCTGFMLMRKFVFRAADEGIALQFYRFFLVNLLALGQTVIISYSLNWALPSVLGITRFHREIASFFGIATPIVTSYFGHRDYSFRKHKA